MSVGGSDWLISHTICFLQSAKANEVVRKKVHIILDSCYNGIGFLNFPEGINNAIKEIAVSGLK